jgi:hypothetical protein
MTLGIPATEMCLGGFLELLDHGRGQLARHQAMQVAGADGQKCKCGPRQFHAVATASAASLTDPGLGAYHVRWCNEKR